MPRVVGLLLQSLASAVVVLEFLLNFSMACISQQTVEWAPGFHSLAEQWPVQQLPSRHTPLTCFAQHWQRKVSLRYDRS